MPNVTHIVVQCIPANVRVALVVQAFYLSEIGSARVTAQHDYSCPAAFKCVHAHQPACEVRKRNQ